MPILRKLLAAFLTLAMIGAVAPGAVASAGGEADCHAMANAGDEGCCGSGARMNSDNCSMACASSFTALAHATGERFAPVVAEAPVPGSERWRTPVASPPDPAPPRPLR